MASCLILQKAVIRNRQSLAVLQRQWGGSRGSTSQFTSHLLHIGASHVPEKTNLSVTRQGVEAMDKHERLELLRKAYKDKKGTQGSVAAYLGVSRRAFSDWINGNSPPKETWRDQFITLLLDNLEMREDLQQFYNIWDNVMVKVWHWDPLTEEEIARKNLDPPFALFLNVPSRDLRLRAVGREELLDKLTQRLLVQESFSLTGKPGVGKTRLVVELARDPSVMTHFSDGIIWIAMGRTPNIVGELTKIADGLSLDVTPLQTAAARSRAIKNAIGQRRILFVIDDVWDLEPVRKLFNFDGPNCCIALTTRDEWIARGFLADPDKVVHVAELAYEKAEDPAHQLICLLAPETCEADPAGSQRLVKMVGGLPLALVLLGGYLAAPERRTFAELRQSALRKLEDPMRRLQLAQERLGALDDQEMTLQAIIELSLEDLRSYPAAHQAFYALGAFASKPEHFTRAAAEQVTKVDTLVLAVLTRRNLVERVDEEWLALHQVLADVARTKLAPEIVRRHSEYYLALVNEDPEDWRQIEMAYGQVRWAWATLSSDEKVLDFVWALTTYHARRGLWDEHVSWVERALQIARDRQWQEEVCALLNMLAVRYLDQAKWKEARQIAEEGLTIAQSVGDLELEAQTRNQLASAHGAQGNWGEAAKHYEANLAIYGEGKEFRSEEALTYMNLGVAYVRLGKWKDALENLEKSRTVFQELGLRDREAEVLLNLGTLYYELDHPLDAIHYLAKCQTLAEDLGDLLMQARVLNNLGLAYSDLGEFGTAEKYYRGSIEIKVGLDDAHGAAITEINTALALLQMGRVHEAIKLLEHGRDICLKYGDVTGAMKAYTTLLTAQRFIE